MIIFCSLFFRIFLGCDWIRKESSLSRQASRAWTAGVPGLIVKFSFSIVLLYTTLPSKTLLESEMFPKTIFIPFNNNHLSQVKIQCHFPVKRGVIKLYDLKRDICTRAITFLWHEAVTSRWLITTETRRGFLWLLARFSFGVLSWPNIFHLLRSQSNKYLTQQKWNACVSLYLANHVCVITANVYLLGKCS